MIYLQKAAPLMMSVIGACIFPLQSYALEPLSDQDMGGVTAQNGSDDEANNVSNAMLLAAISGVAQKIQKAVPLEADITMEGLRQEQPAAQNPSINTLSAEQINFDNIRVIDSPNPFGSISVHDVHVQHDVPVTVRY